MTKKKIIKEAIFMTDEIREKAMAIHQAIKTDDTFAYWYEHFFSECIQEALDDAEQYYADTSNLIGQCYCSGRITKSGQPYFQWFDEADFRAYFGDDIIDLFIDSN